ncbi:hypothetical protein B0H65DRAFT_20094 [Neurospora tetraspora]|uniref:Uncharacterized protein n=1 Tax=Neurospora tetraspora TaxID=94610 RepID=A0AAE0MVP4_9PEZI|nr:hypothetical protein B0H65DRAFT_20094 [Neurospora tetraspora]
MSCPAEHGQRLKAISTSPNIYRLSGETLPCRLLIAVEAQESRSNTSHLRHLLLCDDAVHPSRKGITSSGLTGFSLRMAGHATTDVTTPLIVQMPSSRTPSVSTPPQKSHAPIVPDLMPISGAVLCTSTFGVAGPGMGPVHGPRMPYSIVTYCVSYGLRLPTPFCTTHLHRGTPTHVKHRTAYLAMPRGRMALCFLPPHRTSRAAVSRTADGKPFPHAQVAACIP